MCSLHGTEQTNRRVTTVADQHTVLYKREDRLRTASANHERPTEAERIISRVHNVLGNDSYTPPSSLDCMEHGTRGYP
jgi:hypothetical protein